MWNKGATIDLAAYIRFCLAHPDVSYFVNLDVIPGVPNQKRTINEANVKEACLRGWWNYHKMIDAGLPKEKVIPVFHQDDEVKWLGKYMEVGATYIGISPANDRTTNQKLAWMRSIRRYIFDGAGRPLCQTHGFAVTSYALMKEWEWHSVDSASWKLQAAWGAIYLPRKTGGEYDYSQPPINVAVSPMSPQAKKRQAHITSMSPLIKRAVLNYLATCNIPLGAYEITQEKAGYKLDRPGGELWHDKANHVVMRTVEKGVATSLEERCRVNAKFIKRANTVLPVDHIYFAGAPMPYPLEYKLGRRLLSFHEIGKSESGKVLIRNHCQSIKDSGP